jgi:membrane dipeptidase
MEAPDLHADAVIIDGLNVSNWSREVFEGIHHGGITACNATVAIIENFRQTISNLSQWEHYFTDWSDIICRISSVEDISRVKKEKKTGIILGFQNSSPIEDDLDLLAIFHRLGIRIIQLTYMESNFAGCGCLERVDGGLTDYGIEMIETMNAVGILVDLSHVGYRTSLDAIQFSKKPVALTHANPYALVAHPRNKPDDLLKAVADTGGVIGVTICPAFIAASRSDATILDLVRHIDYLVNLVGIESVGIGTDFIENQPREWSYRVLAGRSKKGPKNFKDYPEVSYPQGIRSAREFPNITNALLENGYPEEHVRKIMGENFLRVFTETW